MHDLAVIYRLLLLFLDCGLYKMLLPILLSFSASPSPSTRSDCAHARRVRFAAIEGRMRPTFAACSCLLIGSALALVGLDPPNDECGTAFHSFMLFFSDRRSKLCENEAAR